MAVYYGSPDDPLVDLVGAGQSPHEGDELCDGHQAHYVWRDGKWQ